MVVLAKQQLFTFITQSACVILLSGVVGKGVDNMIVFLFSDEMTKRTEKKKSQPSPCHPGQVIDAMIDSLDEEGIGCAVFEQMALKVGGVLPGEHVRVKIMEVGRNRVFGRAVKILRRSPDRLIAPACLSAECDACPFVQMKYRAQLTWKEDFLARELKRFFPLDQLDIHPILPSPKERGYRNSAKLVVAGKSGEPLIGIYRKNSHEVVDIADCPLHQPLINKVVHAVKAGIKKGKVPIFSARSGNGLLRYLAVRVSEETGRAMVVFITAERSYNEIHHLAKYVTAAVPEVAVVVQNVNCSTGNVIFGQKDYFLTKDASLVDSIGSVRFSISPRSFFQINSGGARLIYEQVRELAQLSGTEKVLDLYCGVGGISFFLAGQAREVVGIETIEPAVADAEKNAALNGITNCRFIAGDAVHHLAELARDGAKVDLIVLNPPRKGCDVNVLHQAAQLAPRRMIYVSCSPRSLAQDLSILFNVGYVPRTIQPIDMFPQTPHMETVALLEKP